MTDDRTPRPASARNVEYKGEPLDAERGPGLGCFWVQIAILVVFIILTPLSVRWNWPPLVSGILLFAVIGLLLLTGQTIIFLLRLVAADRRGRRRPLASATRTVGELEDQTQGADASEPAAGTPGPTADASVPAADAGSSVPAADAGAAGPDAGAGAAGPDADAPSPDAEGRAGRGPEDAPPSVRE